MHSLLIAGAADAVDAVDRAGLDWETDEAASVNASYNNTGVTRKKIGEREDGTPIYQDTNDSTVDFENVTPPVHRRNGAKQPAWSWSLNE